MFKYVLIFLMLSIEPALAGITPHNGWYWNPDQPGTGFNIEIQRGAFKRDGWVFMAGYFYDESGNPLWVTMQGEYQPASWEAFRDAGGNYIGKLESPVYVSTGGQCVGCVHTNPNTDADYSLGPATISFTSLTQATVEFNGDSWSVQLMDWHDQSNLVDDYEDFAGEWNITGVMPQNDGYMKQYKYVYTAPSVDFISTSELYTSDATLPDGAFISSSEACDWSEAQNWVEDIVSGVLDGNRCPDDAEDYVKVMFVELQPGEWWFVTKRDNENNDHHATYGGVAGRLLISRNEIIGVALMDGAAFLSEQFDAEPTGSSGNAITSDSVLRSGYIRLNRKTDRIEIDDFMETGSAFRDQWSIW